MPKAIELTYQVYSDYKTSDWYIYWDKAFASTKDYQRLIVWHIKAEDQVIYDYVTLKKLLTKGTATTGLPYASMLGSDDIKYFASICDEFIADMDVNYDT